MAGAEDWRVGFFFEWEGGGVCGWVAGGEATFVVDGVDGGGCIQA